MGRMPKLDGDAWAAVRHRGSHVQIIAAAGSGKTEVVSQRVADLLADGVPARGIVAFTFTERAAGELKNRITERVEERLGQKAVDALCGLFVGTIHAYCFRLLQTHVPRYETYDVLDDNQLTAFLSREMPRLGLKQFDGKGRHFAGIDAFVRSVDVVENERLDPDAMPEPFRTSLVIYLETLERYRLLTYGQQVGRAVEALARPEVSTAVHADLRHLIVDEYQDVNPAQEELIRLLAGPSVEVCVVGDDLQAIYQWRGSDVGNIVTFAGRYPNVEQFSIVTNRRSRPEIIDVANRFAKTIGGGLPKQMEHFRPDGGGEREVVLWHVPYELAEAGQVAWLVEDLHDHGVAYRDMAVLVRSRAAYGRLIDQFSTFAIPVQPAGRTGLFDQPEARAFGKAFAWLVDNDWRTGFAQSQPVEEASLLDEFERAFGLSPFMRKRLAKALRELKALVPKENRTANLVGEFYELLGELDVCSWDLADPIQINRLGTLARFTALLADYESVRRRARPDAAVAGEQVGGEDRGTWYYRNLATHIVNYAQGAYEGFDGEPDTNIDAVDLTTVHAAKGLEWPVVLVPSMTANRFPSKYTGQIGEWLVPREMFPAARYEGSDADERRLFYVACTRARDWLSVSRHDRVTKQRSQPSPYYAELVDLEVAVEDIAYPLVEAARPAEETLAVTYSEMAAYLECAMSFRLRERVGFKPRLAPELGYGRAVHHVLRAVADATRSTGQVPKTADIDGILDASFFLPTANKPAHRQLKNAARRLVVEYAENHAEELHRVWEVERPFELHLDGVTVSGRADVILDLEDGVPSALAILDYKTSTTPGADHALQLQVYADAGRREGLDVRGAYVHDLKRSKRIPVDVTPAAVAEAERVVAGAATRLRAHDFAPAPELARCRSCEVRTVCGHALL